VTDAERELSQFSELLRHLDRHQPRLTGFFARADQWVLARAPGRLDVMGGIADYSGSLVLEQPLAEAALVAAARTDDGIVRVASLGAELRDVALPAAEVQAAASSFSAARSYFAGRAPGERWVAYVLGALAALSADFGVQLAGGLRLLVDSKVPEGKGVSSSAAIEVAALRALAALWNVELDGPRLALACQRIENLVVGAPCGVMDQMTSACGQEARLLALLCQPAEVQGFVELPPGVAVFGIDSGIRHAVSGADYGQVRAAAFMGLRLVAERLGARVHALGGGRVLLEADPLVGYLANLKPADVTPELRSCLPERLLGSAFLATYSGISDSVTRVEPTLAYPVRAAALHPVYEHARSAELAQRLPVAVSDPELTELGQLMFQSHASYSACGLGSPGTDRLVELVRAAGPSQGLFGAKITGGGSGGTVAVLARPEALVRLRALAERYATEAGLSARVFVGSSAGAVACPVLREKVVRAGRPSA